MGLIRLRWGTSSYHGENDWEGKPTQLLSHLLVDTISQEHWNIRLQEDFEINTTSVVELASAEDTLLELSSTTNNDLPEVVSTWTGSSEQTNWIAHQRQDAWLEVVVPFQASMLDIDHYAIPLRMQIELGHGSWESSLIEQDTSKETDWVEFDLLFTWESKTS